MDELSFRRGYYLAVANLVRMHDQPTIAAELLDEFGPLNLDGIDEFDIHTFEISRVIEEVKRRKVQKN